MVSSSSTYRRVFVLGSGFSKSFLPSMPTLKDLNALIPDGIPDDLASLQEQSLAQMAKKLARI